MLHDTSDKEIALELINTIEKMYLREIVFKAVLETLLPSSPESWQKQLEKAELNQTYTDQVHAMFQPVRERVLNAPD